MKIVTSQDFQAQNTFLKLIIGGQRSTLDRLSLHSVAG